VIGDDAKKQDKSVVAKKKGRNALKVDLAVGGDPKANKASGLVVQ